MIGEFKPNLLDEIASTESMFMNGMVDPKYNQMLRNQLAIMNHLYQVDEMRGSK